METSDSEYFESADELMSDEELEENTIKVDNLTLKDVTKDKVKEKLVDNKSYGKPVEKIENTREKATAKVIVEHVSKVPDDNANPGSESSNLVRETNKDNTANVSQKGNKCNEHFDCITGNDNKILTDTALSLNKGNSDCSAKSSITIDNINKPPEKCDKTENLWEDDNWDDWEENANEKDCSIQLSKKAVTGHDNSKEETSNKQEEDNAWNDDDWEPLDDKPNKSQTDSWSSWGNWGISSVLSTATNLTSQVTQGITSVIETGIGVPNPEDLAKLHRKEEDNKQILVQTTSEDENKSNKALGFGFGNWVSGVTQITKLVEQTGSKVINGGLDTLETIGKKTVEILQENDPGLKNKTAFLKIDQNKPILSQVLREAKEKAERENKIIEEKNIKKRANYESLFDDHQGLVHLEALEMLSRQCNIKLETMMQTYVGDQLSEMEETVEQVKELCELPEDDEEEISITELESKLENAITEMNIKISYDKLIRTWKDTDEWLNKINLNVCDENELHQQAIESLAQLTAMAVEQYHKAGELLLIKDHRSTADEADSLVQLTITLTSFIHTVSTRFTDKLGCMLNEKRKKETIDSLITNVFFEAANSSSYIKDAFGLLVPVLLIGAI